MTKSDDWGRDPAVKMMRGVFARMETSQEGLLASHGISPHDGRLRPWREKTLKAFEQAWAEMTRHRLSMDEERAATLYVHLLARAMATGGVKVKQSDLPRDPDLETILREVRP